MLPMRPNRRLGSWRQARLQYIVSNVYPRAQSVEEMEIMYQKNYVPYVLETSIGLDRLFLAVFSNSLQEETLKDGSTMVHVVFRISNRVVIPI